MNSQQKIINILTICRKAGKIIPGFDAVKDAIYEGNVSCVIVTEDISDKTLKEVRFICKNCKVDIVELELDSYDMFDVVGKQAVVAAISDFGFANKIRTLGKVTTEKPDRAKPERTKRKRKSERNNSE